MTTSVTRRQLAAAAAPFLIVPRHVLGMGFTPPSDRITLASIGMGRQGMAVTMDLLERSDVQVIAVCDVNKGSKDYAEYGSNALLTSARRMLGKGYEQWGTDLASPGSVNLTQTFRTSLGMGGREPAKRMVEAYYASRNNAAYKGCAAYADFRELLDKTADLDAVYVATPDHWHAPIAMAAMRKKKHVLGQKPMAHSIGEARRMAALAAENKVATSLPVNNPTSDSTKLIAAWIADGAIGKVKEVHNWSSRPFWPQGVERPAEAMPVPENLDWDMWLGPAAARPYHKAYLPFVWRGWFDFGCGSFGDMGCYSFAGIYKILGLTPPTVVEASSSEPHSESYPAASIVHMDFPAAGGRGPVHLTWYDGGLMPARPAGIKEEDQSLFRPRGEGILYRGDKGILLAGFNGQNPRVYPEQAKYTAPRRQRNAGERERERDGAIDQWVAACKGGPAPEAGFVAQRPVTEAFLLGCLAQRLPGERLEWDTSSGGLKSKTGAKFVDPPYRGGWT
ncbi:MAG: Gfo/Idh/MocA family oxidoreductase [Acidobacteria bacterium]|nr:Gfo/Idh/MocA family oxidoreductase [Acidobacteriota bacterium]